MEEKKSIDFIVNKEDFWTTFHKSLKSPNSGWRNFSNLSREQWVQECFNDNTMKAYLEIIFENTPLFNGEYPVTFANETGMILTNYRLFCNFQDGFWIIPLKDISFYGVEVTKGGWLDGDSETFKITFDLNGVSQTLSPNYFIREEFVQPVINKKEWSKLKPEALECLSYSFFDFEQLLNIELQKVDFYINVSEGQPHKTEKSIQSTKPQKKKNEQINKTKPIGNFKVPNIILAVLILIGISYVFIKYSSSNEFGWGWFITGFIFCGICGAILLGLLLSVLRRLLNEVSYMKSGRIVFGAILCTVLIFSSDFTASISNQEEDSYNNSSNYSSPSNTYSGSSNMATCPKCGRTYNEKTWGKMCNVCWKNGEAIKCSHGYPGTKVCPICK